MKSVLIPALENLDEALSRLEQVVDARMKHDKVGKKAKVEPELDLSVRNERDVNRKIAMRLDQTINRLETILSQDS